MLWLVARGGLAVLVACTLIAVVIALNGQPVARKSVPTSWPTLQANPSRPIAVFIGDSYSTGVGASAPGKRWTTLLAAAEGWQEVNLARGGTGYLATAGLQACGRAFCDNYQASVREAIKNNPQIIVVAGGQSDQSQDTVSEQAAIATVYRDLRAGLPSARIVAVGPASPGVKASPRLIAIDAAVAGAAKAIRGVYVSLLDPPPIEQNLVLPKWPFIGDEGHAAIEKRIAAALG